MEPFSSYNLLKAIEFVENIKGKAEKKEKRVKKVIVDAGYGYNTFVSAKFYLFNFWLLFLFL